MMTISANLLRLTGLLVLGGMLLTLPLHAAGSSGGHARKVNGEVLAVNTYDTPNTIVLRTLTAKNKELIVGATVDSGADIKRGTQTVSLGDIQVGDKVMLTYVKTPDGLVARSIKAREGGIAP